jgi:hypothetical protein
MPADDRTLEAKGLPTWKELRKANREKYLKERREKAVAVRDAHCRKQQAEICRRVSLGESMLTVCTAGDRRLPKYETALGWLTDYPDFSEDYKQAQRARGDVLFEEALSIADDARNDWMARNDPNNPGWLANGEHIARSKLRVDTRKWATSKLNPAKYGDKVQVDGNPDKPLVVAVTHRIVQVIRQETIEPPTVEHAPEDNDY